MREFDLKQLGRYEIITEIRRGGFSVVYRAADTLLHDRPVALKVLHPHLVMDSHFVARFKQEAGLAANLHHPNIVTIHDIGEDKGVLFIAMELLDGPALGELIATEGPLPLDQAMPILQQIAAALDYAHGQGLIHRDVKPSNICVTRDGRAVLTDFGLAKAIAGTALTTSGTILGTPEYMSPEQAQADADEPLDYCTDIYSLGVVAYEMLTGRTPFTGQSPNAILYKIVHEPPPPPLAVNPALLPAVEPVMLKALAKRPEDRYQSGTEMVAALESARDPAKAGPAATFLPIIEKAKRASSVFPSVITGRLTRHWSLVLSLGAVSGFAILVVVCLVVLAGVAGTGGQPTPTQVVRAATNIPTAAPSPTNVPTLTPWPTEIPSATPLPTNTSAPRPTNTSTPSRPTSTSTPRPTNTSVPQPTNTPTATVLPTAITWEKDGKEMVLVPAGEFLMGSSDAQIETLLQENPDWKREWSDDEKPQHTVYLDAFYIDKTEVTNAEYKRFVDAAGHRVPNYWKNGQIPAGLENHPVVNVSWDDATAYARWAGKRLPTEAEWEKAARGTDERIYPWGNLWDSAKSNTEENGLGTTTPVGSYSNGASQYGVLDMAGNVWEWVADWYDGKYYQPSFSRNPTGPEFGTDRVTRGGAWDRGRSSARCAARHGANPVTLIDARGFRCVLSISR